MEAHHLCWPRALGSPALDGLGLHQKGLHPQDPRESVSA
jgi:hypothetical protein